MKLICNLIGLILIGCFFAYVAPGVAIFFGFLKPLVKEFPFLPFVVFCALSMLVLIDFGSHAPPNKNEFYVWQDQKGIIGPMSFDKAKNHPKSTLLTTGDENYWWPNETWTSCGTQRAPWNIRLSSAGVLLFIAAGFSWFQLSEEPVYYITSFSAASICLVSACFLPGQRGIPQKPAAHLLSAIFSGPRPPDFDA